MPTEPTASHIAQVKKWTGTYGTALTDAYVKGIIAQYPLMDENGVYPYYYDHSTDPPTKEYNLDWVPRYDLHMAASDIWQEYAATLVGNIDFSTHGRSFKDSQSYDQAMKQVRFHKSRAAIKSVKLQPWPPPSPIDPAIWIGNLPEVDIP